MNKCANGRSIKNFLFTGKKSVAESHKLLPQMSGIPAVLSSLKLSVKRILFSMV